MSEFSAELIGTMLLILLGTGVVANVVLKGTKGYNAGWMVITTGWALSVFVGVAIATPYSGAHLNPAVTVALAIAGKFAWSKVLLYITAQLLGAIIGALLMWIVYRDHFNATSDPDAQLAVFSTGPAIQNRVFNLLSEIVGTFVLIFVIFYFTGAEMGLDKTPVGLGSIGALPVTFLVWAIGLSLGGTTGYAINPARDLGPRIAHAFLPMKEKGSSNWKYAWIPILGPFIGAILAAFTYLFFGKLKGREGVFLRLYKIKLHMIDAVIFDMDGLLIDSEPLWDVSMQEVFATLGVDMSSELAAETRGLRTREVVHYWQNYFKWDSAKSTEDVCDEIINTVTHKIISEGSAMEGLHYILDFFKAKDMNLGLATSSPKSLIDCVLNHLNIRSYFQAVYSAEFEPYGKPHPAVYLSCAKELGVSPVHCLAFEDSINGMVAAKAARMKVVAVPEEHNQQDRRYALADLQLPSLIHFTEEHWEQLNKKPKE